MAKIRKTRAWESAAFGDLKPRCPLSAQDTINRGCRQVYIIDVRPWSGPAADAVDERAPITIGDHSAAQLGMGLAMFEMSHALHCVSKPTRGSAAAGGIYQNPSAAG